MRMQPNVWYLQLFVLDQKLFLSYLQMSSYLSCKLGHKMTATYRVDLLGFRTKPIFVTIRVDLHCK